VLEAELIREQIWHHRGLAVRPSELLVFAEEVFVRAVCCTA
jgi:hypothetical protein